VQQLSVKQVEDISPTSLPLPGVEVPEEKASHMDVKFGSATANCKPKPIGP